VERQLRIFWAGFIVYMLSFFFIAVAGMKNGPGTGTQPLPGWFCAFNTLVYPWIEARDVLFHNVPPLFEPLAYVFLVISGLINPIFLAVVFLKLTETFHRLTRVLKIVVVVMIPFSWVFIFHDLHTCPREGHYLWIVGMLLVLFSDQLARATRRPDKTSPD
jgi:hypothetical protein